MDANAELKERAMTFMKSVAQRSGDPFYTVNPATGFRFVFVNEAACRHFGRSREELLRMSISEVDHSVPPDQWPYFWEELKDKGALFFETIHRHTDGREIPVAVSSNLFAQGEKELFGGCIHDLSEHRQTEEALKDSEEMLRVIFNSTYDGILLHAPDGSILDVNNPFLEMYNLDREEALKTTIEEISSPTMSMEAIEPLWSKVLKGEPQIFEWKARRVADGSEFDVEVYLRKVYILRREAILANVRDITARKEFERIKNQFISTTAHELRTPLTSIVGYLELLIKEDRFTPEERKEFLRSAYQNSEVLNRIIRNLLDLSLIQAGKPVTLNKSKEDVNLLVRKAVEDCEAPDGVSFEVNLPGSTEIEVDPSRLKQVLDHLLENAIKFSPAGRTIRITGRFLSESYQVTIEDQGIGMHPEEVASIFDEFYRADGSNTGRAGMGLGMSLTKKIVEAHGGRIWVESQHALGTVVHFTLPFHSSRE